MKTEINNVVVKNESREMGARIIAAFKKLGVETEDYIGWNSVARGCNSVYYGLINGIFSAYDVTHIYDVRIITIDELEAMANGEPAKRTIGSLTDKEVINVRSEAEDLAIRKLFHEVGKAYSSGDSYLLRTGYLHNGSKTCYTLSGGYCLTDGLHIAEYNESILPATDFLTEEQIKSAERELKGEIEMEYNSTNDIQNAIDILKANGYKVSVRKEIWEEV